MEEAAEETASSLNYAAAGYHMIICRESSSNGNNSYHISTYVYHTIIGC